MIGNPVGAFRNVEVAAVTEHTTNEPLAATGDGPAEAVQSALWHQPHGKTVFFPPSGRHWPTPRLSPRMEYAADSFQDDNCSDQPTGKSGGVPSFLVTAK
jgi:hypothetical protein